MTLTNHKRIRRSQTAEGNLVRVGEPQFLTLTSKPANERPFPIIRSDDEEGAGLAAPARARIVRPVKRSVNPVLRVAFPAGYDEDKATAVMTEFHMTGYNLSYNDDSACFVALRSDLQSIANTATTDIKLTADGVVISLDAAEYPVQRSDSKDHLAVVSYEFDAKRHDVSQINAWLSKNSVDSPQVSAENSSGDVITVQRSEIADGTDVKRVELEDGIVAVVTRSEVDGLPENYAAVVNECMYGDWGWGQLDFDACMADRQFCRVMSDAREHLDIVLDRVIRHSQLPLEARKQLVNRTLAQYGEFVGSVIDALPRQVMLLVTRAAEPQESNKMTIEANGTTTTTAAPAATTTTAPAAVAAAEGTGITMTRADLDAAIAAGVSAELVKRADAEAANAAKAVADAAAAEAAAANAPITRSDLASMIAAAVAPLAAQVEAVNNTVVLRSDAGDARNNAPTVAVKRSEGDVFKGAFGLAGRAA